MNDSPLKILLAEGGSSEASVSLRTFSTATGRCDQMCLVPRSASLLEALQKHRPDVALLQMLVLQPDPAATVSHLHECAPEVALIIWAEPADKEIAAQCIQAGKRTHAEDCADAEEKRTSLGFVGVESRRPVCRRFAGYRGVIPSQCSAANCGAPASLSTIQRPAHSTGFFH